MENNDGIFESGLSEQAPVMEASGIFESGLSEQTPVMEASGILESGLAEPGPSAVTPSSEIHGILRGQTGETSRPSIINKFWAIDYERLREFETTVDRLVSMHKNELVDLLALESAMVSIVSSSFCEARLRYGMFVRDVERSNGHKEVAI